MEKDILESGLQADLDRLIREHPSSGGKLIKLREGERRDATMLFIDVKDFTALSERLDHEEVYTVMDYIFKIFTGIVERYGGYVGRYEGDSLLAFFGGRESHEDDAERALTAALKIGDRLKDINGILNSRNIEIAIRTGINSGPVTSGKLGKGRDKDFTLMGDAINTASRLEQCAPPGGILVSESTRNRAGERFVYRPMEPIKVKGKRKPLCTFLVEGKRSEREERWERMSSLGKTEFAGRKRELEKLVLLYRGYPPDAAGIACVTGPAGTGKSRLVHEFLSAADTPAVLRARNVSYRNEPFRCLADLITRTVTSNPERLEEDFRKFTDTLEWDEDESAFIPYLEYLLNISDGKDIAEGMEASALKTGINVASALFLEKIIECNVSRHGVPTVVVIEDMHWMDGASIDFLDFLTERDFHRSGNCLMLLLYRDTEELDRRFQVMNIPLTPLDDEDSLRIIHSLLKNALLPETLTQSILERAEGIPLYMEELVKAMLEENRLKWEDGKWKTGPGIDEFAVPESLRALIQTRIDGLDRPLKTLLQLAAVIGREFGFEILKGAASRVEGLGEDFPRRLERLVRSGLIEKITDIPRVYQFRHNLVRDTAEVSLLNYNRRNLHRAVALEIERQKDIEFRDRIFALAHHYRMSGDRSKTLEYLVPALEEAAKRYDSELVLKLSSQIIETAEDGETVLKALDKRCSAYEILGERQKQFEETEALITLAEKAGNSAMVHRGLLHKLNLFRLTGRFQEAFGIAENAVLLAETVDQRAEALLIAGIVELIAGSRRKAQRLVTECIGLCDKTGNRSLKGRGLNLFGNILQEAGEAGRAVESFQEALDIYRELGDVRMTGYIMDNIGIAYQYTGDYGKSLAYKLKSLEIEESITDRWGVLTSLGNLGELHRLIGDFDKSEDYFRRALKMAAEVKDPFVEAHGHQLMGHLYYTTGKYPQAIGSLKKALALSENLESDDLKFFLYAGFTLTYAAMGKYDTARDFLEKLERCTPGRDLEEILRHYAAARVLVAESPGRALEEMKKALVVFDLTDRGALDMDIEILLFYGELCRTCGGAEGEKYLRRAGDLIMKRADSLNDPVLRYKLLNDVPVNASVLKLLNGEGG